MAALAVTAPLALLGAGALLAADTVESPNWILRHNKIGRGGPRGPQRPRRRRRRTSAPFSLTKPTRGDGRLIGTQGVMASKLDWEPVEGCLRDMVQAG